MSPYNKIYSPMQFYGQPYVCPMNPGYICPFYHSMEADDFTDIYEEDGDMYPEDDDMTRQRPQDINRIMARINQQFNNYYTELQRYGVQRVVTRNIFRNIVTYVLRNEDNYTGNITQKTNALFNAYRRDNARIFIILRGYGVPNNRINQIIRDIIRFTLENIDEAPTTGWSQWEDLGGILTSGPAVASWQANRLDVFGRGQNNALWHKWWDGSRWSEWEDLGGVLTSAPAAVSWGPNRIDVFGRGQNNSLWHKWWNGSSWSQWEDLGGGPISSAPAAASTGNNRLEVFARGRNNQLLFRTWNGSRWSGWQSLDGVLTSEPAAVSWGGNRLDVFARGQNNHLWHIWRP
ncbi:MAG TPA: sialidase [Patescibacteria group bacterium]|nr:sialidase [Patescibacteria group bacterium]